MKRHIELVVKLILICILALLFCFIWRNRDTADVVPAKPLVSNFGAIYELKRSKEQVIVYNDVAKKTFQKPSIDSSLEYYAIWEQEHYYAAKVFKYFMQKGFTREAVCAIIGNMMIETSGGDLNLKPNIYSKSGNYYGLCQWSLKYYPETKNISFEQQLDYLFETMPWEFNTFGWLYKKGFGYEDFIKMTDTKEAALAFAKVYERCGPVSHELRKEAAEKAYTYFNLKHSN